MKILHYLQQHHKLARRTITSAIKQGLVLLDGEIVESFSQPLSPWQLLQATIEGNIIHELVAFKEIESEIICFHKPSWYVCSKFDKHNKTIYQLLDKQYHDYYYIGRLDKDSRGLILLTNDTTMVNKIEHPRSRVEKEYVVTVKFSDQWFARRLIASSRDVDLKENTDFITILDKLFRRGLLIDENGFLAKKWTKADLLKVKSCTSIWYPSQKLRSRWVVRSKSDAIYVLRIILTEWKKRQLRRLLKAVWGDVKDILRIRVGDYTLENLKEGELK